jgi:2-hydroxychromene-2-carboxylate isomerase
VLKAVLDEAGFRGGQLIADVTDGDRADWAREQLKANTTEAIKLGLCGAPTYQFEDYIVWGQDRLNLVQGEKEEHMFRD